MNIAQLENVPVAFLVRHAEKQKGIKLTLQEEIARGITTQGRKAAKQLGETINNVFNRIVVYSSPIKRCIETATALAPNSEIKSNHLLGDPGAFISNNVLAAQHFSDSISPNSPYIRILKGEKLSGMRSAAKGTSLLLNFIIKKMHKINGHLYLTHDSIMALFLDTILPISMSEITWPNYLEMAILTKENGTFFCYWRDKKYVINNGKV